ncbi:MAG: glycosyltransferase [Verrucomicrobiae bacterium]|nr:glycosyltransferase [Verrucomicrobiae bacterium]
MNPTVSFVVPCYKYAHHLAECVNSILSQSFTDFEVIIMDDCSPDHTPEVAASFKDPRVTHVRHERNIGAVANINDGIRRARGKYVWVLSADDALVRPDALADYIAVAEKNPGVGMLFSSGVLLPDPHDTGDVDLPEVITREGWGTNVIAETLRSGRDEIIPAKAFFVEVANTIQICPPTVMFRTSGFAKAGLWPEDASVKHCPDWLLWARFAFFFDVAFIARPAAGYRMHAMSECRTYRSREQPALRDAFFAVLWKMLELADGDPSAAEVLDAIVKHALSAMAKTLRGETKLPFTLTIQQAEQIIRKHARSPREATLLWRRLRREYADVCSHLSKRLLGEGDRERARVCCAEAVRSNPLKLKTWLRLAWLSCCGGDR